MHTFCEQCLKRYVARTSTKFEGTKEIFSCPMCRRETVLPEAGVVDFTTNFFLTSLEDTLSIYGHGEETTMDIDDLCNSCVLDNRYIAATVFCEDCSEKMCDFCAGVHGRLKSTRSHRIVSFMEMKQRSLQVENLYGSDTSRKINENLDIPKGVFCSKHSKQPTVSCCLNCSKLLCVECMIDMMENPASEHKYHHVVDLKMALKYMDKTADSQLGKLQDVYNQLQQSLFNINELSRNVEDNKNDVQMLVLQRYCFLQDAIDRWRELCLEKIEDKHGMEQRKLGAQRDQVMMSIHELETFRLKVLELKENMTAGDAQALLDLKQIKYETILDLHTPPKETVKEFARQFELKDMRCLKKMTVGEKEFDEHLISLFGRVDSWCPVVRVGVKQRVPREQWPVVQRAIQILDTRGSQVKFYPHVQGSLTCETGVSNAHP